MKSWPTLRHYDADHLSRIAMPIGGIGTGQVSLGGRGDLRDWELMNRPAKGYKPPIVDRVAPFFAIRTQAAKESPRVCALEGPLEDFEVEGAIGSPTPNHGLPRFRECSFDAAYPFGQVHLADRDMPVKVTLEGFNPLIPGDVDRSSLPVAVLRYRITNRTNRSLAVSVCGSIPNFIGEDGSSRKNAKPDQWFRSGGGVKQNRNRRKSGPGLEGIFMDSQGVPDNDPAWGTMAFATTATQGISHRTAWLSDNTWSKSLLDFWEDFAEDGHLDPRKTGNVGNPTASLSVSLRLPAKATKTVTFLLSWHFPNRQIWKPQQCGDACDCARTSTIGNYYTSRFRNAWAAATYTAKHLNALEHDSLTFVNTFLSTDLPHPIQEAALFNLAILRSQTVFRTPDGRFFGWEGCGDRHGCCFGSCTHVWNYEQALPFLFGELSRSMREIEFAHATDDAGIMSFRVNLPIDRAREYGKAAADGQMGCIMKLYRDWQLSGDDRLLADLWPHARRALEFCWLPGGWDADQDGVMEGCQHNTMDVEYFGPNPQMGAWYLGALRAAEQMALHQGEPDFADRCRALATQGARWMDKHLFNGEYYEHHILLPDSTNAYHPATGKGKMMPGTPDFQLGAGCLVDQLVGQYMAHVCGLGHLLKAGNVRKTLRSIYKYNRRVGFTDHFNNMRSFAMKDETALLMAAYPGERPAHPFPYFTEVMTGFEYVAAVGMLQEGIDARGLQCIQDIRARYDGRRRNPFDEAECGHYYARAMASWAGVLAWTGFHYSAVAGTLSFADRPGTHWWSTGDAWGTCRIAGTGKTRTVTLTCLRGALAFDTFTLTGREVVTKPRGWRLGQGKSVKLRSKPLREAK